MRRENGWPNFLQEIRTPLTIYLWSEDQLKCTQKLKNSLMKKSRNSLFFDSTGNIVQKDCLESKRVFLYTLLLYIPLDKAGEGILMPVAEGILTSHFAVDIQHFLETLHKILH